MYIALEGGEGSGKGTQLKLLGQRLVQLGHPVKLVCEPGGTQISDMLRKMILFRGERLIDPLTEFLLYTSARSHLLNFVIRPSLAAGTVVVSDRCFHSSGVYQGVCGGVPRATIRAITEYVVGGTVPDLVLLLDIDPAVGLRRKKEQKQENWFESQDMRFHHKVRRAYLELAAQYHRSWVVIDAAKSVEEIHHRIMGVVLRRM